MLSIYHTHGWPYVGWCGIICFHLPPTHLNYKITNYKQHIVWCPNIVPYITQIILSYSRLTNNAIQCHHHTMEKKYCTVPK